MSKHKKKKQKELPAPPLSKLDDFLYNIVILAVSFLFIVGFMLSFYVAELIAYSDTETMLFSSRGTYWLIILALMFMFIPVLSFFGEGLSKKKPIFGNKKIDYFSTTRYRKVYFLFEKKKTNRHKKAKIISVIVISIFVVLLLISALFSRNTLNENGGIRVYSIFNNVKAEYLIDDISNVTIEFGKVHTRHGNYKPMCWVVVETKKGKEYSFQLSESSWINYNIEEKLENIKFLKKLYDSRNIDVTVIGEELVDDLAEHYELSEQQKSSLVEMFK